MNPTNTIQLPFELTTKRIYYLIPIPFLIFLLAAFIWILWIRDQDPENPITTDFYIVFSILIPVGFFLIGYFLKQFLKPGYIFRMTTEGVDFKPSGISTGLIPWHEIREVKEIPIVVNTSIGPATEKVLAIMLKDPEKYREKKPVFVRQLMHVSDEWYGSSIFINPAMFGSQYEEIKAFMQYKLHASTSA